TTHHHRRGGRPDRERHCPLPRRDGHPLRRQPPPRHGHPVGRLLLPRRRLHHHRNVSCGARRPRLRRHCSRVDVARRRTGDRTISTDLVGCRCPHRHGQVPDCLLQPPGLRSPARSLRFLPDRLV